PRDSAEAAIATLESLQDAGGPPSLQRASHLPVSLPWVDSFQIGTPGTGKDPVHESKVSRAGYKKLKLRGCERLSFEFSFGALTTCPLTKARSRRFGPPSV